MKFYKNVHLTVIVSIVFKILQAIIFETNRKCHIYGVVDDLKQFR